MVFLILIYLMTSTGCTVNRAYTNGQEAIETVFEKGQILGQADLFSVSGNGGSGGVHAGIHYSPLQNVAAFYDIKTSLFDHQYHSLGIGYYLADYKKLELLNPSVSKSSIDIGRHLDFYGGLSYGISKNSSISAPSDPNVFPRIEYLYDLSYRGRRFFGQIGGHVKSKFIAFDATFRQVWMDPDKIEIFGLGPGVDVDPIASFTNPSYRSYSEFSFKMNMIGLYKPLYFGFTTRFGDETGFTRGAFASQTVFIGVNSEIYHVFTKKAPRKPNLDLLLDN